MIHRGYTIEEETNPWCLKLGKNFRYYPEGETSDSYKWASSIEEAKEEINDIIINDLCRENVRLQSQYDELLKSVNAEINM